MCICAVAYCQRPTWSQCRQEVTGQISALQLSEHETWNSAFLHRIWGAVHDCKLSDGTMFRPDEWLVSSRFLQQRLVRAASGSARLVFSRGLHQFACFAFSFVARGISPVSPPLAWSSRARHGLGWLHHLAAQFHWSGWFPGLLPKLALTRSLGEVLLPQSLREAGPADVRSLCDV